MFAQDDPENVLRVAVTTGGCSGFSYQLRLVKDEPEDDDMYKNPKRKSTLTLQLIFYTIMLLLCVFFLYLCSIVEKNGGRVFIDEESMKNLAGSTIDYSHAMIEESFQVLANPHAEGGCGCGASFNLL